MKIIKPARAGSMESNDIYIMLLPYDGGVDLQLNSKVIKQFGKRIKKIILLTLEELNITEVQIIANDSGALDYTIKSRVMTAVERSLKGGRNE